MRFEINNTTINVTARQLEVLGAVFAFCEREGWAPTVRELCCLLGAKHPKSIHSTLLCLERKKLLKRSELKSSARAMAVTQIGRVIVKGLNLDAVPGEFASNDELVRWAVEMQYDNEELRKEIQGKNEAICVQQALYRTARKKADRATLLAVHFEKKCLKLEKEKNENRKSKSRNVPVAACVPGDTVFPRRKIGRVFCGQGASDQSGASFVHARHQGNAEISALTAVSAAPVAPQKISA